MILKLSDEIEYEIFNISFYSIFKKIDIRKFGFLINSKSLIFFSALGGLTNFVFGIGFGWVGPALAHLSSDNCDFEISEEELSWVASMYFATEVFSSILAGLFSTHIGRKPLITFASFLLCLSWLIMILANSAFMVIFSRGVLGLAAGMFDITWSIYLGEITDPQQRGVFGSIMVSLVIGGEMVEFALSLILHHVYLSVIPFILSVVSLILCIFMVEAPQFHLMRKNDQEALMNLAWLRGQEDANKVKQEFNEMKQYIVEETQNNRGLKQFLKSPSEYKVYVICVVIFSLAQLTGNIIILSYQTIILEKYKGIPSARTLILVYGILQFLFVNLNTCFIETIGRRILLLIGFSVAAVIQTANAGLIYLEEFNVLEWSGVPFIILILFNVYGVVFIVFILPTVFVLKSELFPQELKAVGSVSSTVSNALAEFIVTKLFMLIWISYGLYVNFCLYSFISLVSVVYVYILIPETKGKSLIEIQKNISAGKVRTKNNNEIL